MVEKQREIKRLEDKANEVKFDIKKMIEKEAKLRQKNESDEKLLEKKMYECTSQRTYLWISISACAVSILYILFLSS